MKKSKRKAPKSFVKRTEAQKRKLLAGYDKTPLGKRTAYCEKHGIHASHISYWRATLD